MAKLPNKVIFGTETLIDLTGDTVAAASLATGYTAHGADGQAVTGTAEIIVGELDIAVTYTDGTTATLKVNGTVV